MKILNNLYKNQRFAFCISNKIPYAQVYNFKGIEEELNIQKIDNFHSFVNENIDPNLQQGFKFAIENMMSAINQNDLQFFQDIGEEQLSQHMEQWINFQNKNNLQTQLLNSDEPIQLFMSNLKLIYGVKQQRSSNKRNLKKNVQQFPMVDFVFYGENVGSGFSNLFSNFDGRPIVQFHVFFKSRQKLILKNKDNQIISGSDDFTQTLHKVIFEGEAGNISSQSDVMQRGGIFSLLKNIGNQNKRQNMMKELMFGEDFEWKISDVDNCLDGNPFN